ncbi:MAG: hypothetical protein H6Q60_1173 [Oscillospiraceae bacterium]|nr:hypothetical protein [Oscillospiraceae bacterium]
MWGTSRRKYIRPPEHRLRGEDCVMKHFMKWILKEAIEFLLAFLAFLAAVYVVKHYL